MHCSKAGEIQAVRRSLSVNLNPCAHAVRSTRRHSGPVAGVKTAMFPYPIDFKSAIFPVFLDDQVHVRAL
jgi:hypothetical protein